MTTAVRWNLEGDYFENCNCDIICPCEVSPSGPLAASPTQGHCDLTLAFHVERGSYGDVSLNGLNVVAVVYASGPMGQGGMKLGMYVDQNANAGQQEALQAIFSGAAGGPMAAFAPLVGEILGIKSVPITYTIDGKRRRVEIPNIMNVGIHAVPSMKPDGSEIWLGFGHPFNVDQLAVAVGEAGSYNDYGMQWDNSGKNGHYAKINWAA